MSYDESDEEGEWEVVDIVHTSTSVKPDKKPKPAKQEDVDKLAQNIQSMLSLKSTHDTQQILLLEQKMKQQQKMSEQQLSMIQNKLAAITRVQHQQEAQQKDLDKQQHRLQEQQKQQLIEQQVKIQSLSEHQMLTQKHLQDAEHLIKETQAATQHVNHDLHSIQQLKLAQQQLQEQIARQQVQLAQTQHNQQHMRPQPPIPNIPVQSALYNQLMTTPNTADPSGTHRPPNRAPNHAPNTGTNASNGAQNGWLPSFLMFGNQTQNQKHNINSSSSHQQHAPQHVQQRQRSPSLPSSEPEEKQPMMDTQDDEEVLNWANDYGAQPRNPLLDKPQLLKTKGLLGEGKFSPGESRQCGWILRNTSSVLLKLSAQLECIGGEQQVYGIKVAAEKSYEFSLKPSEEVYILVEVTAPVVCGKYAAFYQLQMSDGSKIGETLEVLCDVESTFSKKQEEKIESVIKMGFERKQVVSTLRNKKWNVQACVDLLLGLSS